MLAVLLDLCAGIPQLAVAEAHGSLALDQC